MEQALEIDLILEKLFQVLPFRDLKNARFVNRYWNKIACSVLRKRALVQMSNMGKADFHMKKESKLFRNQQLLAKVPFELSVMGNVQTLCSNIAQKVAWVVRVQRLNLRNWSIAELNLLLPFVLYNMTNVEVLIIEDIETVEVKKAIVPEGVVVPPNPTLPLKYCRVVFQCLENDDTLSSNFLRWSPNLKVFCAEITFLSPDFINFAKQWSQDNSKGQVFRMDRLIVNAGKKLWCECATTPKETEDNYIQAVIDFIEMNQPKSLTMNVHPNVNRRILRDAPARLSTVTRLSLTEDPNDPFGNNLGDIDFKWEEIPKNISSFPALQELYIAIRAIHGELQDRENKMKESRSVVGYLKDAITERLRVLEVSIVSADPLSLNTAILALFRGSEPQAELKVDIIIGMEPNDDKGERLESNLKVQLSVSEFQSALQEAENALLVNDPEDNAPQAGGSRRRRGDGDSGDGKRAKTSND